MNLFTTLVEFSSYDSCTLCSKKGSFFEHLYGPISHRGFNKTALAKLPYQSRPSKAALVNALVKPP
jgi:hypothetical protein